MAIKSFSIPPPSTYGKYPLKAASCRDLATVLTPSLKSPMKSAFDLNVSAPITPTSLKLEIDDSTLPVLIDAAAMLDETAI